MGETAEELLVFEVKALFSMPSQDPLLSAATPPPARYDFAINLLMLISFMDATEYSVRASG